jgi:hypothetical protein
MTPTKLRTSGYDERQTRFTMSNLNYTPQLVEPYYEAGRIGFERLAGDDNQAANRRDVRTSRQGNAFQYAGPTVPQLVGMASFTRSR